MDFLGTGYQSRKGACPVDSSDLVELERECGLVPGRIYRYTGVDSGRFIKGKLYYALGGYKKLYTTVPCCPVCGGVLPSHAYWCCFGEDTLHMFLSSDSVADANAVAGWYRKKNGCPKTGLGARYVQQSVQTGCVNDRDVEFGQAAGSPHTIDTIETADGGVYYRLLDSNQLVVATASYLYGTWTAGGESFVSELHGGMNFDLEPYAWPGAITIEGTQDTVAALGSTSDWADGIYEVTGGVRPTTSACINQQATSGWSPLYEAEGQSLVVAYRLLRYRKDGVETDIDTIALADRFTASYTRLSASEVIRTSTEGCPPDSKAAAVAQLTAIGVPRSAAVELAAGLSEGGRGKEAYSGSGMPPGQTWFDKEDTVIAEDPMDSLGSTSKKISAGRLSKAVLAPFSSPVCTVSAGSGSPLFDEGGGIRCTGDATVFDPTYYGNTEMVVNDDIVTLYPGVEYRIGPLLRSEEYVTRHLHAKDWAGVIGWSSTATAGYVASWIHATCDVVVTVPEGAGKVVDIWQGTRHSHVPSGDELNALSWGGNADGHNGSWTTEEDVIPFFTSIPAGKRDALHVTVSGTDPSNISGYYYATDETTADGTAKVYSNESATNARYLVYNPVQASHWGFFTASGRQGNNPIYTATSTLYAATAADFSAMAWKDSDNAEVSIAFENAQTSVQMTPGLYIQGKVKFTKIDNSTDPATIKTLESSQYQGLYELQEGTDGSTDAVYLNATNSVTRIRYDADLKAWCIQRPVSSSQGVSYVSEFTAPTLDSGVFLATGSWASLETGYDGSGNYLYCQRKELSDDVGCGVRVSHGTAAFDGRYFVVDDTGEYAVLQREDGGPYLYHAKGNGPVYELNPVLYSTDTQYLAGFDSENMLRNVPELAEGYRHHCRVVWHSGFFPCAYMELLYSTPLSVY